MEIKVQHLHTYFLFPFSIDQEAVMEDHSEIWKKRQHWFEHLDTWVTQHAGSKGHGVASELGGWRRSSQRHFSVESPAYQDMVFFHPFVRRTFFDTGDHDHAHEALLHCYTIKTPPGRRLLYEAEDNRGQKASLEISDLRLSVFANGISILAIGVETSDLSVSDALWINEMMRKIYPSSDRQIESGRIPRRVSLEMDDGEERRTLVDEKFDDCHLIGFRPRLSAVVLALLYFADYEREEFEPVLDERMIVNTFVAFERDGLPRGFETSEEYDILLSRFLFVDRAGEGYRYEPEFTRGQLAKRLYRRWQHEGTVYGMTSYSQLTAVLSSASAQDRGSLKKSLVYRMFASKNNLIALVALFYRATLLDFLKASALVSRQLFPIFSGQIVRHHHIQLATRLMADFHYFDNYWFFSEITTKDEEFEHFRMLCDAYRVDAMKAEVGAQIGSLAGYIDRLYALRNNDAVNRLAVLSMILGLGALVTGFYGMNIPHLATILSSVGFSRVSFVATLVMTLLSLALIGYIVVANWIDYRSSLVPHQLRRPIPRKSLRRISRKT